MLRLEECNDPGILLVHSQPTSPQYIREIEEWYDTEHGPARLRLGNEYFANGCRLRSLSDTTSWLAMYEMQSLSAGMQDPYTSLRAKRSLREQEIFRGKLEVKSRQFLRLLAEKGSTSRAADMVYVIWFETNYGEEQIGEWYYDSVFDIFTMVDCSRSRLFQLVDGTDAEEGRILFVGIHDFDARSEHLEPAERIKIETMIQGQEHVVRCSRIQAFILENEFSALDYRAPCTEDVDATKVVREQVEA